MHNTETETSMTYPLSGAYYTIERNGQCAVAHSDNVKIIGTIYLPAWETQSLKREITFDTRLAVMGGLLFWNWGLAITLDSNNQHYRCSKIEKSGESYTELFSKMREYLITEIMKLENALQTRIDALVNANK